MTWLNLSCSGLNLFRLCWRKKGGVNQNFNLEPLALAHFQFGSVLSTEVLSSCTDELIYIIYRYCNWNSLKNQNDSSSEVQNAGRSVDLSNRRRSTPNTNQILARSMSCFRSRFLKKNLMIFAARTQTQHQHLPQKILSDPVRPRNTFSRCFASWILSDSGSRWARFVRPKVSP